MMMKSFPLFVSLLSLILFVVLASILVLSTSNQNQNSSPSESNSSAVVLVSSFLSSASSPPCDPSATSNAIIHTEKDTFRRVNEGNGTFPSFTENPSPVPSSKPSIVSSTHPSQVPSTEASSFPSIGPSTLHSTAPSTIPSLVSSRLPSFDPTPVPTTSNKPSRVPSSSPFSRPSVFPSQEPTNSPSITPTSTPFSSPSSSPSFMLQEFRFSVAMDFDILDEFEGYAKETFENVVRDAVKIVLDQDNGEDFQVISLIQGFQVLDDPNNNLSRRSLAKSKLTSGMSRNIQQKMKGLRVLLNIYANVRSATKYTTASLVESVTLAFDEEGEREAFILDLQVKDAETFSPINVMNKFSINNDEVHVIEKGGPSAWIYICIGAGGGILIFSLFAYFVLRRRHHTGTSITLTEIERMNSPVDPNLHRTIECLDDAGDVSTMGDTFGHPGYITHQPLRRDEIVRNPNNFDYRKPYSGLSLQSSASECTPVSVSEEKIIVFAPPGNLGVVIGTPKPAGQPTVHGIKEDSALYEQIQIGDRLISVDGQNTVGKDALFVSKLIGSKAMNPRRVLVFLRPLQGSQTSNI